MSEYEYKILVPLERQSNAKLPEMIATKRVGSLSLPKGNLKDKENICLGFVYLSSNYGSKRLRGMTNIK